MPTVILNKEVFEKLVGKKLPLESLKDRISMLGTDLEKIEGNEIHVEVFPNRPDMLSEQGFARAFSAFIGVKKGLRRYKVERSGHKVIVDKSVSMRPYTACAIVKGLKFNNERIREIIQVQEKLATTHGRNRKKSAYGLYPLDAINFPIKYIAKDPEKVVFQPLGFDRKIRAIDVEKLHPTGQKYKGVAKGWTKYPFFIDAKDNVMSMLPYTNSHDTGRIELDTKNVFIECTGNDQGNVNIALNILTTTLADMGGKIFSLDIEYPDKTITTPDLTPSEMDLDLDYINKLLGVSLTKSKAVELLERMEFGFANNKVLVPAWRNDILHQRDLVEDIAIAFGYENFEAEIPKVATIAEECGLYKFKKKVANLMTGLGLLELNTYHITNKDVLNKKMNCELDCIELENALTEDYSVLRSWMIPMLLQVLSENTHHEYPQNVFEIGEVFAKDKKTETGVKEYDKLAVVLCSKDADFTKIKQVFDYLMSNLGLDYLSEATDHDSFISGRVAKVSVKGKKGEIACLGELHPQVLANFNLEVPAAVLEVNVNDLWDLIKL